MRTFLSHLVWAAEVSACAVPQQSICDHFISGLGLARHFHMAHGHDGQCFTTWKPLTILARLWTLLTSTAKSNFPTWQIRSALACCAFSLVPGRATQKLVWGKPNLIENIDPTSDKWPSHFGWFTDNSWSLVPAGSFHSWILWSFPKVDRVSQYIKACCLLT